MASMVAVPVHVSGAVLSGFVGASKVLDGETASVETLVTEHLPMVHSIARKLHRGLPQHVELEELVSAGMLGLLDAAQRFQEGREAQFRTFAQFRVRGAILDSLRQSDWGSRDQRRRSRAIEAAITTLTQRLGRSPEEREIAAELKMEVAELRQLLGDLRGLELGSLQETRGEDSEEQELEYLADTSEPGALFRCLEGELRQHLAGAIESLPERERLVITLSYYEELTMKEIAQVLGVVESRVSQMRSSAVLKLRAALKSFR